MSKVIIEFKPDGSTSVQTKGVPGMNCHKASEPYEQALHKSLQGATKSSTPTAEAKMPPAIGTNQANLEHI